MRPARGFASLALSAGYLNKEIFSLRLGNWGLSFPHGAAGDGDDRQGNGACRGDAATLFINAKDERREMVMGE